MIGWRRGSAQSALRKDLYYSQGEKEEKRCRRALQEEGNRDEERDEDFSSKGLFLSLSLSLFPTPTVLFFFSCTPFFILFNYH